jgi:preprotein translocase subunit YajC
MSLMTILLQAQGAGNAGVMNIIFIVAIVAIFYFFMIRPQSKRQKEIKKFRDGLQAGDQVVTAGGIYGKIKDVRKDGKVELVIANGVSILIAKDSIYQSVGDAEQK